MDSLVAAAGRSFEGLQGKAKEDRLHILSSPLAPADQALVSLGQLLREEGYVFTTITPLSHRRVRTRRQGALTLRDLFGWSRSFPRQDMPTAVLRHLEDADALEITRQGQVRSTVRFSTLEEQIFVHSAFPTDEADAVFFGPDTYRFARLLRQTLPSSGQRGPIRLLDIGTGSGAGGIYASKILGDAAWVVLTDINRKAVRFSRINAALNALAAVDIVESDLFRDVKGSFDVIVANPPYLIDSSSRVYRHGGGRFGEGLSVKIAAEGLNRLTPGGRLILYTGTSIIDGADTLHFELRSLIAGRSLRLTYEEIDPDVFGEELDHAPYDGADRIAVVAAVIESENASRGHS